MRAVSNMGIIGLMRHPGRVRMLKLRTLRTKAITGQQTVDLPRKKRENPAGVEFLMEMTTLLKFPILIV